MSRASAIGAVIVASGILVGGSIISVYAINSSVIAEDAPHAVVQTAALVAPSSAAPATSAPASGPVIGPEDLTVTSSDDELIVPIVPNPAAAQTGENSAPTSANVATTRQRSVGAATAQGTVSRAAGGRLLATWATQHSGVAVYAVKVQRGDGSIVVGYVDRSNGAVVDWARVSTSSARPAARPKPKPSPTKPSRVTHSAAPVVESPSAEPTTPDIATPSPTPRPTRHHGSRAPSWWSATSGSFGGHEQTRPDSSARPTWTSESQAPASGGFPQSDD